MDLRNEAETHVGENLPPFTDVRINPHIDMKAADGSIVVGWLASQTDMLAEDWVIVSKEHSTEEGLRGVSTRDLVNELMRREGTQRITLDVEADYVISAFAGNERVTVNGSGPAILLAVID
jgi:hypothetical protein